MRVERDRRLRLTGYLTFGISGVCAMSAGVVVSLLQDRYGFSYQVTGSLLTCMNVGNMAAAFLTGLMASLLGVKGAVLLLCTGYALGYGMSALTGAVPLLMLAFLLVGLAKGSVLNTDSVLVGTHSPDRKVSLQLMHSSYAVGALLCPFLLNWLSGRGTGAPLLGLSAAGLMLFLVFLTLPGEKPAPGASRGTGKEGQAFLRDPVFWLLALLLFCQNGAEYGVTGWMVTYYKNEGILTGQLSAYAMTIMWGATLTGRLLIAFALRIRSPFRTLTGMGAACFVLYALMIALRAPVPAMLVLIAFSLAMAGTNPMITASVGESLNSSSMAVMLPIGSLGGIGMPLLIGLVSEHFGIRAGMAVNLLPCLGLIVLSLAASRLKGKAAGAGA